MLDPIPPAQLCTKQHPLSSYHLWVSAPVLLYNIASSIISLVSDMYRIFLTHGHVCYELWKTAAESLWE